MSFRVKPASLDAFEAALAAPGLAQQAGTAGAYLDRHTTLSSADKGFAGQVAWVVAIRNIEAASAAVRANLERLGEITTASAAELGKAADVYRRTDKRNARRLDATY